MTLLKAHQIQKSWNKKLILDSVSLDLNLGNLYQLRAENGKGKTTFLKICAGLVTQDKGNIECQASKAWCSSHGNGEIPRLTGLENIQLMNKIFKTKKDNIDLWRELSSFSEALETEYGKCSDGMKMLISLYISTLAQADLLLWDEPFAHLSYENSQKIINSWQAYTGAKTIIFSSHELIQEFSGEVITL